MDNDYLEFRPVRLSQRITAAAMTIAFVPIAAMLLQFAIGLVVSFLGTGFRMWDMTWLGTVTGILSVTSMSFVASWIGFLFLVPITHRRRPERFLQNWWRTTGLGATIGFGFGFVLTLFVASIVGSGEIAASMPFFAAYGALFAFVYWAFLRLFFARRIPPVQDVFA